MKIILSKIFVFFLFLSSIFYLLSSATHVYAASQPTPAQPTQYISTNTNPDVPNNLHNWTQNVMIEVMSSLTCQLTGTDPINPKQSCLGIDQKNGKIGFLPSPQAGGAIGFMGNMIATLYTPPLHTADYFQNLAQNFGISKKTYAENTGGTGFQSLTPLIGIWSAFRNIVYLILVIIFVVIGLAIMLRVKIDPRTVMTIQNQIPKIIIGILAVTFSFAIAGFLIDMMWVLIYLIYGIFSRIQGVDVQALNPSLIQGQTAIGVSNHIRTLGIFGIANNVAMSSRGIMIDLLGISVIPGATFGNFFEALAGLEFQPLGSLLPNFLIDTASLTIGLTTGAKVAEIVGNIFTLPTGSASGATGALTSFLLAETALRFIIPYGIVFLIVFIALLTALFRLWLTLIMAYVQILLSVVLAPFWIIGGIVPGSPISLSGWFKNIGANLLAFPATIAMFMLGKVFVSAFGCDTKIQACKDALEHNFVPPLIGNPGDPSLIGSLIGLGIILMTPNIINMLKQMLKVPKMDMGIGKALAPGLAVPGRTVSGVGGLAFGSALEKGFLDKTIASTDPITGKVTTTIQKSALGTAMRLFRGGGR